MTGDPAIGPLHPGQVVLDHACGGGTDLLLAARRVRPGGRAIDVDMTPAMREVAAAAADACGLGDTVEIRDGLFENLPVDDDSVDVVISNGVVNLAPDKPRVFREIARVLKPRGRLLLADVIVQHEPRSMRVPTPTSGRRASAARWWDTSCTRWHARGARGCADHAPLQLFSGHQRRRTRRQGLVRPQRQLLRPQRAVTPFSRSA